MRERRSGRRRPRRASLESSRTQRWAVGSGGSRLPPSPEWPAPAPTTSRPRRRRARGGKQNRKNSKRQRSSQPVFVAAVRQREAESSMEPDGEKENHAQHVSMRRASLATWQPPAPTPSKLHDLARRRARASHLLRPSARRRAGHASTGSFLSGRSAALGAALTPLPRRAAEMLPPGPRLTRRRQDGEPQAGRWQLARCAASFAAASLAAACGSIRRVWAAHAS